MSVTKVIPVVTKFFENTLNKKGRVIEVNANEDGWNALFETVEEDEYMRKIAQDEMVAIYEIKTDNNFAVQGYSRKSMRPRKQAV